MKRLLIAMLALLTGLAVQTAPATARAGGLVVGAEVGAVAAIRAARVVREENAAPDNGPSQHPSLADRAPELPQAASAFAAPTIRLGADRARE